MLSKGWCWSHSNLHRCKSVNFGEVTAWESLLRLNYTYTNLIVLHPSRFRLYNFCNQLAFSSAFIGETCHIYANVTLQPTATVLLLAQIWTVLLMTDTFLSYLYHTLLDQDLGCLICNLAIFFRWWMNFMSNWIFSSEALFLLFADRRGRIYKRKALLTMFQEHTEMQFSEGQMKRQCKVPH